ncbi:hypothetical protein ILUMI_10054 [Ignelater luminosus]|uniref:Circadian clock-controlled protein n=1 Tax=Ignelater luminosus TaxID=2038154 RepID=A0A8K0CYU9_IGNLU|nr:hypothetical protein ILUMI_10054 [Ignelater luminosus]
MGIPEYNITKADPLDVPYLVFNRVLTEDTTIIATLRHLRLRGFSQVNVHSVNITSLKDWSGEFTQSFSHVNLTMEHQFDGKLLSLPLGIEGMFSGNFTDVFGHIKVSFKSVKRGQQRYFAVDRLSLKDHVADGRVKITAKNPENQPASDFISNFVNVNTRPVLDLFVPRVLMGIPEYNITKPDPLDVPYLMFDRVLAEDTTIIAIFKNVRFRGLSEVNVHSLKITSLEDMSGEFSKSLSHAYLTMEHIVDGKLLSLPLGIEGKFSINFTEISDRVKVRFKSVKRGQQRYFAVDRISMNDIVTDGHVKITAKNPENQPASDFITNFINTNSKPVFERLIALFKETCEDIMRFLVDRALAKVPAEELFSE